jgi:endonuclease/exonuclease/phosphatase family metal-dependent hydrolase
MANLAFEKMTLADSEKIRKLRELIKVSKIPPKQTDENLLICTFNIREFGAKKRKSVSINALAEICSKFDIIAIQELRSNLEDLKRLMTVLGPYWKVIFNDPAGAPRNKGNDERFAYIYDSRVVRFTGMAAELLISDDFFKGGHPNQNASVPWRTPFFVSFKSGMFDFMLLTVHIQWNTSGGIAARAKEIEMISEWVEARRENQKLFDPDIFVLGDFNIPSLGSSTFKALKKYGLTVPKALQSVKTNLKQNAHYDQIAYYKENTDCSVGRSGNLDFYDAFFTKNMLKSKYDAMTYEISDHLPLWVEFKINEKEPDQLIMQEF